MPKVYLSASELNARLAQTRNQVFRQKTQSQLEGYSRLSIENAHWARTPEGRQKIQARNRTRAYRESRKALRDIAKNNPLWLKRVREANAKKKKTVNPAFAQQCSAKALQRLQNPAERKRLQRWIAKRERNPQFVQARARRLTEQKGIRCRVRPWGKEWQTFDSFSLAAKHYQWNDLAGSPRSYFPEDGSVKTGNKGQRKGWQTQRIIK